MFELETETDDAIEIGIREALIKSLFEDEDAYLKESLKNEKLSDRERAILKRLLQTVLKNANALDSLLA